MNKTVAAPLEFEKLSISQKAEVERIRLSFGNTLYLYTFASLFSWKEDEGYEICIADNAFIVKNNAEGDCSYLFPCGSDEGKKELIDTLLLYEKPVFYALTDNDKFFLENEYPNRFHFENCRNEYSYLYDKNEQIELKGKAYKSLRHQINTGRASAEKWTVEPINDGNIKRALDINEQWTKIKGVNDIADLAASQEALKNFSKLSMWGLIFNADGKDVAYIAGTFVTPEIFDISFCKVLDNNCDCFIKWALYCELPKETKTVDSEEDLGLEGLRRAKMSYNPEIILKKSVAKYVK